MLYYLFRWLDEGFDFPGAGVFQYISFRAAASAIVSLLITIVFGGKLINILKKQQIGETVRDLGLAGQKEKEGTPTMGGLIILFGILVPVLLFCKLDNIYIIIMIITTIWLGLLGFMDDYIKVFKKHKEGMNGWGKILGQISLGIIVGSMMFFSNDIVIKEKQDIAEYSQTHNLQVETTYEKAKQQFSKESVRSTKTTIPFIKGHEFDYSKILKPFTKNYKNWAWLIFIPIVILIITAVSNGANLTDGIDGLATGTSAIIGSTLGILAWVSGNIIFANYLNIMYIPNIGELTIFIAAFVGATAGFLWYNTFPAQVFMGDTGSLTIGGIIAVLAILIRKEWLLVLLCGIFLVESVSVIMQVSYFKYTKKKYGEGKRIFLMTPIHHHFQKKGWHESKIVQRFFLISIILAVITIITLKLR
ncbi:MAG: phospho-N-acetylmuramoyl-pentapeptide-transferase [Bacteroidales bacterium]|nr:phospho-N-acetylmuramoyl-pentapeptide-transferase [Bacteroidales bacterium]